MISMSMDGNGMWGWSIKCKYFLCLLKLLGKGERLLFCRRRLGKKIKYVDDKVIKGYKGLC